MPRAKKPKYSLPEDFYEIMKRGDPEEIKAVFQDKELLKFLTESKESRHNPLFKYSPCTEIYKWFVEQGFDITMIKKSYGQPIHYHAFCQYNNIEGIILAGADIEAKAGRDDDGATPLEIASQSLQPSSMKVLIKYGADVHVKRNGKGLLHTVISEFKHSVGIHDIEIKAFECMELLINAGVEIEDGMKDEIIVICKEIDKRKNSFKPYQNDPQPYEDGVNRMCELFGVERPASVVHDGKSPITVTATDWREQHAELWDKLVPGSGKCRTVQGEVVRIGGKINYEIFHQSGMHWDADFRKMLNALKKYYEMGTIPDEEEHQEALALIKSINGDSDGDDVLRLCEINIHWVLANPEPIELGEVNYKR